MSATWGTELKVTIFGESHGFGIGAVIDGLPAGILLDMEEIRRQAARRRPGQSAVTTARSETDDAEIISGIFNSRTTGAPLCAIIKNGDKHSGDYDALKDLVRPGHADYAARAKFGGFNDHRGGGHFSGRLTAALVFAGAVARQLPQMRGVAIGAHIASVADIVDKRFDPLMQADTELFGALSAEPFPVIDKAAGERMRDAILSAKNSLDSLGGTVECAVCGLPAGLGEPFFDSAESLLAHMIFSIPGVKGIEFGSGFGISAMKGSEANDSFAISDGGGITTLTNHNGGINGGITNSMPVMFTAAFKPTPSIARKQQTVNVTESKPAELELHGRHDPCIVPRAVPVVEAAAALVFADLMLRADARKGSRP